MPAGDEVRKILAFGSAKQRCDIAVGLSGLWKQGRTGVPGAMCLRRTFLALMALNSLSVFNIDDIFEL